MTIGGRYKLGTGFLGLGVAIASEANFFRMFPERPPDAVNLGLVTLKPGADPGPGRAALRAVLPADTQVFTRPELVAHEVAYWTIRTATGLIFGSGLVVSFVVGIMVLYQTLATQITRQLPQFATLKAIGYSDRYLDGGRAHRGVADHGGRVRARRSARRSASMRWSAARPCCRSP